MKKPREFRLRLETLIVNNLDERQQRTFPFHIHVREVVPIDWEKVWKEYSKRPGHPESHFYIETIQELVEKSLKGEL